MARLFFFLVLEVALTGPNARAMQWEDFRRGEIEDRRAGLTQSDLDPSVQELLVRAGKLAAAGKFPFICPGLKPAAKEAADLGAKLEKADGPWKLKSDFDRQFGELVTRSFYGPADVLLDACKGAMDGMLKTIQGSGKAVYEQNEKVKRLHDQPSRDAAGLATKIRASAAHPTIGDRINNWMGKCPQNVQGYLRALEEYPAQVAKLREDYEGKLNALRWEYRALKERDCGQAPPAVAAKKKPARKR